MTLLWIAIAILLLPALWLLVSPLRNARALHDQQRDFEANDTSAEQNVAIFKRRLASLEAALERGDIDAARFEEDRLELERSLLEDTAFRERRPLKAASAGRIVVPVVMLAVVAVSVIWYQQKGAEGDLVLLAVQQEVQNDPDGSLAMYIERMEEQAERQPDNPNVWSELFPLYRETGQMPKAVDALERLIEIEGRIPPLLAQLAQIRFFMAERELTDEVQALVDETLEQDPRQPTVLGLLGINAFDNGDYEQAIDHWRRAIANIEDPNTVSSLRDGIRVAQERLGIEPEEAVTEGTGIRVRVSLDEELVGRVDGDASVFITARDIEGELPPLAVVRAQVSELPMTVTLDNSVAMSPQAQISQVQEARLVVRVSPSGQAAPQPGDLFGDLESVSIGPIEDDEAAEVVINRVFE
ncbi:c-type cytochrome biogenesis protein CcmI [Halomonas sp. ATBC28]|jgi:cytochrome c-type biogenesis protein CcmH|uniref:c-type cytochrome biogenesis protein CcmI n=1 Tax=Halomonadaceae TaxID=28256 RepID=UPI000349E39F|nr:MULTISPECIES: c-type cytochrome biogenesis protein CcmI [Halomonas]UEQ04963.1 c-type cytochrome biogenesis protein CcmI [Halomonas profundus]MCD1587000.1 c-type cytochrome biogenesis protein CcmI [Halomonas sp. IOP_14]MCE7518633.1 c-type cytochrome biogenesis protein CcmI [Halomonas titanicae]NVE90160.1 c-type cytochrome biogenesis protein CcmI [Halomonas titanicae]QNU62844.1 c-type cytochrome biogenesis protein CcmI [Halomonas titanicae]|tara:strand:- start:595 stop:1833 length:1239 start_codon:yes stop_codon:yes gene_type:complete